MLLTRLVFGEARGGPPERWRATAASVIVRAAENYMGRGMSIHAQALSPGAYSVFNLVTGAPTPEEQIANMKTTLDPARANNGEETFKKIYAEVAPMVNAMEHGDYSVLPPNFTGPAAWDSFRARRPQDKPTDPHLIGVSYFYQGGYPGPSYGTWPWPGVVPSRSY